MGETGWLALPFEPMVLTFPWPAKYTSEESLEAGIVARLADVPGRIVVRQPACCGLVPDIVVEWGRAITIVEVKRHVVGRRALAQLTGYVEHWLAHRAAGERTVYGILAARGSALVRARCCRRGARSSHSSSNTSRGPPDAASVGKAPCPDAQPSEVPAHDPGRARRLADPRPGGDQLDQGRRPRDTSRLSFRFSGRSETPDRPTRFHSS
jgi:hypothetical protein